MKKIFLTTLVAAALAVGCTKQEGVTPDIAPETPAVSLDGAGEVSKTINVKSSLADWNYTVADPWLTVEKKENALALSAPMYVSEEGPRKTRITLKAGGKESVIEVEQSNLYVGKIDQGGVIYWLNPKPEEAEAGAPYPRCRGLVLSLVEAPRQYAGEWVNPNTTEGQTDAWAEKLYLELLRLPWPDTFDGKAVTKLWFDHIDSFKSFAKPVPHDAPNDSWGTHQGNVWEWFVRWYYPDREVNGYNDWYIPSLAEFVLLNTKHPLKLYDKINAAINAVKDDTAPICGEEVQPLDYRVKPEDELTDDDYKMGYSSRMHYMLMTQPIRTLTPEWVEITKVISFFGEGSEGEDIPSLWNTIYNRKWNNGKYTIDVNRHCLSIILVYSKDVLQGQQISHGMSKGICNEGYTYRPIRRF